jgi:hypothetical protein
MRLQRVLARLDRCATRRLLSVIAAAAVLLGSSAAFAGTIVPGIYRLLDHGYGSKGVDYGLRFDSLSDTLFSTELGGAMTFLTWNGGVTANISGTLHNNDTSELWMVDYDLEEIDTNVYSDGWSAGKGSGILTDPSNNDIILTGKKDGSGSVFIFRANGHGIPDDDMTPVGRGWLEPPGDTNDWKVKAALVPEPGTAVLLSLGLTALAIRRRQ